MSVDVPGVSIVQRVDLQAPFVGYLDDDDSIDIGGWFKLTGSTINQGTYMPEVADYTAVDGKAAVAGFARVSIPVLTGAADRDMYLQRIREVTLCLKGLLWKKNVTGSTINYMDSVGAHPTGVLNVTTGVYIVGKAMMAIPAATFGLVEVDLINQRASA
jgi:hypothetical protein